MKEILYTNYSVNNKMTGEKWGILFNLKFNDFKGFSSEQFFRSVNISRDSFLLMASNCDIDKPQTLSRRESNSMKQIILGRK